MHIISTEGLKLITFGAQWLETKFWFQNGKSYLQILTNMEEKSLVFHLQKYLIMILQQTVFLGQVAKPTKKSWLLFTVMISNPGM